MFIYGISEVTIVRNVDSSSELIHNVPLCIWYTWVYQHLYIYDNKILQPEEGVFVFL